MAKIYKAISRFIKAKKVLLKLFCAESNASRAMG